MLPVASCVVQRASCYNPSAPKLSLRLFPVAPSCQGQKAQPQPPELRRHRRHSKRSTLHSPFSQAPKTSNPPLPHYSQANTARELFQNPMSHNTALQRAIPWYYWRCKPSKRGTTDALLRQRVLLFPAHQLVY